MTTSRTICSAEYRQAARVALAVQVPIALLSMLVLDMGQTARVCGVAMLGFWCVALLIVARRPWSPTRFDLLFWRWGFVPCFVFAMIIGY